MMNRREFEKLVANLNRMGDIIKSLLSQSEYKKFVQSKMNLDFELRLPVYERKLFELTGTRDVEEARRRLEAKKEQSEGV